MAVGIIGSGNVGANTAFFIAEKNIAPVRMHDAKEGLSIGKALDMMEAAPVRDYQFPVSGTDNLSDLLDSQVIIIAAGQIREPGMKREDLYETNREVVLPVAEQLRGYRGVVVVATEPVDMLVKVVQKTSGLPWQRVVGLGGVLDSQRLRYVIARELRVAPAGVSATVVGQHSDAMIPLTAYTTVSGVPVTALIDKKRLGELHDEVRDAGDTLVDLYKRANSYYGPAAAATDVAEAVVRDTHRVLPVSFVLQGQYGVTDAALSLPAVIGREGIVRVLEPRLTDEEKARFVESADVLAAVE
jgi:malate dehydrogenase